MNTIKDYCNLLNGYSFKSDKYVDKGIRVVRITNVQKGEFVDADPKYYPLSEEKEIQDYLLQENDLLISLTGNVGRVCKISKDYLPAGLNQRVACLRIKNEKLLKDYLYFYLMRNQFENDCINNSKGIAQLNLSTIWLENYPINVPSLEKQEVIVKSLSKIGKNIADLKENLESLNELTKSRFIEMFGTLNSPKFAFNYDVLENVCHKITDGKHGGCTFVKGTKKYFVGAREIYNDKINYETAPEISQDEFEKDYKRCNLQVNDFIIVNTGATIGKSAIVKDERAKDTLLQKSVALIKVREDILNNIFLKYCYIVNPEMYIVESGSAQPNLLLSKIKSTKIYIPNINMQNEFACFVEQIDKLKFTEKEQLLHCSL